MEYVSPEAVIDITAPEVSFQSNGNTDSAQTQSTIVGVIDDITGVKTAKYSRTETQSCTSATTSFSSGDTISKTTGDGVRYLCVYAEDMVGNSGYTLSEAFTLDNTSPEIISLTFVPDDPGYKIGGTVTATLVINETGSVTSTGWEAEEDGKTFTKVFNANTTEALHFQDIAGNTSSTGFQITWLDNTAPYVISGGLIYSPETFTSGNVLAQIITNRPILKPAGWSGLDFAISFSKRYENNIDETITLDDNAGNTGSQVITINRIDRAAPEIQSVTYDPALTNKPVTITVTAVDQASE